MYQKSLESLIKTANQAGAIVICEYRWPASWPSCWDYQSLTCILNMNEAQHELRWKLQRLIFEKGQGNTSLKERVSLPLFKTAERMILSNVATSFT